MGEKHSIANMGGRDMSEPMQNLLYMGVRKSVDRSQLVFVANRKILIRR